MGQPYCWSQASFKRPNWSFNLGQVRASPILVRVTSVVTRVAARSHRLCYTDTLRGVTYPYPILVGYADTDTRIHHFSGFSFEKVCIRVSDTYCIRYSYPYSCNVAHRRSLLPVSLLSSTAPPAPSPALPLPSPAPSSPPPLPSPPAPSPMSLPLRPSSGSTAHSSANSSTPPSTSSPRKIGSMRGSSSTAQPCRRRRALFRLRHPRRRRGLGVGCRGTTAAARGGRRRSLCMRRGAPRPRRCRVGRRCRTVSACSSSAISGSATAAATAPCTASPGDSTPPPPSPLGRDSH